MRIARNLRLSVRVLSANRLRTALAVGGTAIGVAGVLALTAIGEGARAAVIRRIEGLGRNMLVVTAGKMDSRAGRTLTGEGWTRQLRVEDVTAIETASRHVVRAAPGQDRGLLAKFGPIQNPATVLGTTPEWQQIRQFPLAAGRFFTEEENRARARVAVLGWATRMALFPDSVRPVGSSIRIGRIPFEVVGVLASKGTSVDGSATEDDRIVVPLETALRRVFNTEYLKVIFLEVRATASMSDAQEEVAAILRERHDIPPGSRDDFSIQNQRVLIAAELATQASFQRLIMGLGFLSLLIGGAGILSIMLLSARERRPEIGLRVAVGAGRPDIAVQFLAEAMLLAAAGGVAGIVVGIGAAELVASLTALEARVSGRTLLVAVGAVAGIGLCSGVYPAWRAASVDPIEALQS
jgi:ABC-type antimicrobial peptide transport system permease subunit